MLKEECEMPSVTLVHESKLQKEGRKRSSTVFNVWELFCIVVRKMEVWGCKVAIILKFVQCLGPPYVK